MADKIQTRTRNSRMASIFSIIGTSLALLIMGIMGLLFITLKQMGNKVKEDILISAYLQTSNADTIQQVLNYVKSRPYAQNVVYVDKEMAKSIWNKDGNESWDEILDYNPLPESIDFNAKVDYVNADSLEMINKELSTKFATQITQINYPKILVNSIDQKATKLGWIFLVIASILVVLVAVSIDNTIRLTMYSNRFLIKTMQMVGATRRFITRPIAFRSILNGFISACIACVLLHFLSRWLLSKLSESQIDIQAYQDAVSTFGLYVAIIILGVLISWVSTNRSIVKYLKSKIENLY